MKTDGAIILAFDLGTTNLKAALFDGAGRLIAISRCPTPAVHSNGRAELDITQLFETLTKLVKQLGANADLAGVQGISFASQANSFALFDDEGGPLTPIILWCDVRALGIHQPLNRHRDLQDITGVPSVTHEFAQSKLRWIALNAPEVIARSSKVSFISDVLVEWLTGKHATELGLGCLTALATRAGEWSSAFIAELGVPNVRWPQLLRAGTGLGELLPSAADRLGLPRSARVYMGCLDQYAGAIGTGAVLPGSISETTGTVLAAVQCVTTDEKPMRPSVFEGPSFSPDRIFRMTFSSTSANLLEWYRNNHLPETSFDDLVDLAGGSRTSAVIGSVTTSIADAFSAAALADKPGAVVRGIMQRVSDELATLIADLDATGDSVRSSGGAARSEQWLQMKADRLGVPILAASTEEPTCRGAAMLAATGMGLGSIDSLAEQWCSPRATFLPRKR